MSLSDKLIADSIFLYLDFCTPFLPSSRTKACRGIGELFSIIEHGLWSDEARLSGLLPFFEGKSTMDWHAPFILV